MTGVESVFRRLEVDSVDAYVDCVDGYEGEVRQIGAGPLELVQDEFALDGIQVLRWSTNRTLSSLLQFERGWTVIGAAQRTPVPAVRCNGVELSGDDIVVASHADEFQNFEPAGVAVLEVAIRDDVLATFGLLPGGVDDVPSRPEEGRFTMSALGAQVYRTRLNSLIDRVESENSAEPSTPVRDEALEIVAGALSDAAVRGDRAQPLLPPIAYEWVGRTLEELRSDPTACLDLGAVAERVGTTPRTLQRAFGQMLGVSPYQYLLRHRLNDGRIRLREQPDATITEVAHHFGFTSSGFAHQYRRLFGQRPSDARLGAAQQAEQRDVA